MSTLCMCVFSQERWLKMEHEVYYDIKTGTITSGGLVYSIFNPNWDKNCFSTPTFIEIKWHKSDCNISPLK